MILLVFENIDLSAYRLKEGFEGFGCGDVCGHSDGDGTGDEGYHGDGYGCGDGFENRFCYGQGFGDGCSNGNGYGLPTEYMNGIRDSLQIFGDENVYF